jgi:uncharacterized protein YutE (UPF0331/DUF86 family)
MGSAAEVWTRGKEAQFLETLRPRYESEGYEFIVTPARADLPPFFDSYEPDAIARKAGSNVAIEVKRHQSATTERTLQEIRRLFDGHADWKLNVVFMGFEPLHSATIPLVEPSAIRNRLNEVNTLCRGGHLRSGFILAWSLLEAAFRTLGGVDFNRPRTPGTVVQTLAMNGYIDTDLERQLRGLIELRNRIVHGDVDAEPTRLEIELVVSAIQNTLGAQAV